MFDAHRAGRRIELFVFDIYIAIQKIKKATSSCSNVQALLHNFMAWDSVIREFEIIGEASRHLLREKRLESQYQVVVDFRNQIAHGYFGIDPDIVWTIIHTDLPELEAVIVDLVDGIEPDLRHKLIESFVADNKHLDFVVASLRKLE